MTDGPTDAPAGSEAANQSRKPLIVLCAPEHPDLLETQFARYVHEYDVRTTASAAETSELLQGLAPEDQVAMLVSETEVPDEHVMFLTDESSEYYLGGLFQGLPGLLAMTPRLVSAFNILDDEELVAAFRRKMSALLF